MIDKIILFIVANMILLTGCASKSSRQIMEERNSSARPRHAAYAAEGFTMDHRSPEPRAYRAWDFYYKHCTLVSRNPWPTRAEYDCAEPE